MQLSVCGILQVKFSLPSDFLVRLARLRCSMKTFFSLDALQANVGLDDGVNHGNLCVQRPKGPVRATERYLTSHCDECQRNAMGLQ